MLAVSNSLLSQAKVGVVRVIQCCTQMYLRSFCRRIENWSSMVFSKLGRDLNLNFLSMSILYYFLKVDHITQRVQFGQTLQEFFNVQVDIFLSEFFPFFASSHAFYLILVFQVVFEMFSFLPLKPIVERFQI